MKRRFFVPRDLISDRDVALPPDSAHRARNVLRLRDGDAVELFDGSGASFTGTLQMRGREVRARDLKPVPQTAVPRPDLALAVALIKPARFEWMLEKATELGVDEFIPLVTRHTEFHGSEPDPGARMLRWLRIVRQACEQCGRSTVPAIRKPLAFRDFITLEEFSGFTRLLCCEKAGTARRMEVKAGPSVICIGPEGGWDQEEIETSIRAGYRPVSLGENILRVETAALAAVILVRSTDWGFLVAD